MATRKDDWGMTPESQVKAQKKYDKKYTTGLYIKLNIKTDRDIIHWLWKQESKQGAIKQLIRKEIEREASLNK